MKSAPSVVGTFSTVPLPVAKCKEETNAGRRLNQETEELYFRNVRAQGSGDL